MFIEFTNAARGETLMKRLIALLWALLALATSARAVDVSAPSALLMEKETGTVLFAKDEHTQREPASVTKVMTLLPTPAPWGAARSG